MTGEPAGFERPVSPRGAHRSDPTSQLTPIRGELTTIHQGRIAPPPGSPASRFARPADRYEIPVEQPEPEPAGFPVRRLLTWLVAVMLVAVGAGWAYVKFLYNPKPDTDTIVQGSQSAGPRIERADELVRTYLTALATGDTGTAMSLGKVGSGDPAAIASEAYRVSLAAFPITDIQVPAIDNPSTVVPASYRIGDQEVTTQFRVVRDDSGFWELANATVQVELQKPNAENLPVLLNGVAVPGGVAELLPGRYVVSTGLPLVDYPETSTIAITNLDYDGRVQRVLTPLLTDAGRTALLEAGQVALNACLSSGSLEYGQCPNRLIGSAPYDPSSVRWELVGDPWSEASVALDPRDQTQGQLTAQLTFAVSFTYSDGSTNGRQVLSPVLATCSGSLMAGRGNQLTVLWGRPGG